MKKQYCSWCDNETGRCEDDSIYTDDGSIICESCFDAYESGQQSCAASPWTYRTDTGDEHGKVVESAELPEKGAYWNVIASGLSTEVRMDRDNSEPELMLLEKHLNAYRLGGFRGVRVVTEDWLRKHLIAYAEIRS